MKRVLLEDIGLGDTGVLSKDKINSNFDKLNDLSSKLDDEIRTKPSLNEVKEIVGNAEIGTTDAVVRDVLGSSTTDAASQNLVTGINGKVQGLNSQVNSTVTEATYTEGSYYNGSGNLVANANSIYGEKELTPGKTYCVYASFAGDRYTLVRDKNGNVLESYRGATLSNPDYLIIYTTEKASKLYWSALKGVTPLIFELKLTGAGITKDLADIRTDIATKVPTVINYAPLYPEWSIRSGITTSVIEDNSIQLAGNSTVFGFEFLLADSEFEVGDTVGFGVKDIASVGTLNIHAVFFNDSTEISRTSIPASNITGDLLVNSAVIPENTTRIVVRFQGVGVITFSAGEFILSQYGITTPFREIREPLIERTQSTTIFVDPTNGSDDNVGSDRYPLKTIAKAIEITGENTYIYIKGNGILREKINIKQKANQRRLNIIVAPNTNVVNYGADSVFIDSATNVQDNIYSYPIESFDTTYKLFQHNIADTTTSINANDWNPLYGSRTHRCKHTLINSAASLDEVISNINQSYYYDAENSLLYFKIADGSNLTDNPVVIPKGVGIYGNDGTVELTLIGMKFHYCLADLSYCHNAVVAECEAGYANGGNSYYWSNARNLTLRNCEATRCFDRTIGDGFNSHGYLSTATMVNCWAHDCNDDGYSDHANGSTLIYGGLFEFCGKGGLTPSSGATDKFYGVVSRYNTGSGFYYIGTSEGGIEAHNCSAYGNGANGFYNQAGKKMSLFNCRSYDNGSFGYYTSGIMELNDCLAANNTGGNKGGSGNFIIKNTSIVE
nr:MAG TPA: glycoside hydrolase [Caudoviricetes sp.]